MALDPLKFAVQITDEASDKLTAIKRNLDALQNKDIAINVSGNLGDFLNLFKEGVDASKFSNLKDAISNALSGVDVVLIEQEREGEFFGNVLFKPHMDIAEEFIINNGFGSDEHCHFGVAVDNGVDAVVDTAQRVEQLATVYQSGGETSAGTDKSLIPLGSVLGAEVGIVAKGTAEDSGVDGYGNQFAVVLLESGMDDFVGCRTVDATHASVFLHHGPLYLGDGSMAFEPFARHATGNEILVFLYFVARNGCGKQCAQQCEQE